MSSRNICVELSFILGFGFNSVRKAWFKSYKTLYMWVDRLCGVGGGLGGEVVEVLMWSRILFWDSVSIRSESVCCEFAG